MAGAFVPFIGVMAFVRIAGISVFLTAVAGSGLTGCDDSKRAPSPTDVDGISNASNLDPCSHPNAGCECSVEGDVADCGKVVSTHNDYVTCSAGTRTCTEGVWGECVGERVTDEPVASSSGTLQILSLGSSAACSDQCDPYCNRFVDTPTGYSPGTPGFTSGTQGLTLVQTGSTVPCTSLTLTPVVSSLNVTSLTSPYVTGGNTLAFTLVAAPIGCATPPFATTWAVDKVDRATISGTTSANGVLTLAAPYGGPLRVTAFAQGLNTYVDVPVNVSVLSTAPAAPNLAATAANILLFGPAALPLSGVTASTANWLYPYADTYFPLGLLAPVVQYNYSSAAGNGQSVKVSLRYPSGKNLGDSTIQFNYAMIVKESNVVSASAGAGIAANVLDPQVVIPQAAWKAFEQTARGNDADLVVQRLTTNLLALENESRRRIHFVDGQLKGTVYYNSYNSTIGGSTSTNVFGAVLKIRPQDTVPTQAVPYVSGTSANGLKTNGVCTVCHTVSANGSTLAFMSGYTNGPGCSGSVASSGNYRGNSCAFTLSPSGVTWINTYTAGSASQYRFNYGAPYPDGSFYLSNAWDNTESFGAASGLAQTSTGNSVASVGAPPIAVTPAFSADGRSIAYNDGTDGLVVVGELSPCKNAAGNTTTYKEFVVLRNDSPATVDVSGWTVKRSNGTLCFTVPSSTSLASGAITTLQGTADCLLDTTDTVKLYDAGGELRYTSAAYSISSGTCGSGSGKYGSILSCAESWSAKTSAGQQSAACSAVTASADMATQKLKVKDFSCGAATGSTTCNGTATKTFSGERTVVDCASAGCVTAGNPSFLPDGRGLLYQHVTTGAATSAAYGGSTLVSQLNTWQGAQAEVWLTNANQSPSFAARKLFALNGYTSAGVNYLPLRPRTVSTPTGYTNSFHDSSAGTAGWVYDKCAGSSPLISATVNEDKLNYIPTVAPQEAGGKYWVIFTSRRLYGSVATSSPWQAERSNDSTNYFGPFTASSCNSYDQYSPGSGLIETKKLWIAAVDKDWETSGVVDPSHPAFYLPGQELISGNSHGYWVSNACAALGASCDTSDDCCNGTGSSASVQCNVVSTASVPPTKQCAAIGSCSSSGESCASGNDCCTGLSCPTGGGVCLTVPALSYHHQTLTRDYDSACPAGLQTNWRFFEWQATIPTGTSIAFSVQARKNSASAFSPATPALMSTAVATTPTNQWDPNVATTSTAGEILATAAPSLEHAPSLRVTMDFYPDSAGLVAPTLQNWRQVYDCADAQ